MPELLLELGCEELPATAVQRACQDLHDALAELLHKSGLTHGEGKQLGTPRRLIVAFEELAARQDDSSKEQRGPALRAAYDTAGNPTPALLGFCRSQGVEPDALRKDDQYVWVTKTIEGRSTSELLGEIIPQVIRSLSFDKTMRWGTSRMRFARPIRWILAAFDGKKVELEVEGVQAGLSSRGHRFYAPESFEATSLSELVAGLRKRFVEPDPEVRRQRIVAGAEKVADGTPVLSEALVAENVFLTEWPTALQGQYRPEFQTLPEPVLVTAMAKHEKMFPVRDDWGKLTNNFVFVRNSGEDATVRRGSEWVLNARFNDAKFFYDEDAKRSLDEFLDKTSDIVFHEKLGSVRQRADRLAALSASIAESTDADAEEISFARQAGLYCKADLSTGLVSELASLQGIVGGEYARREGLPDEVCWAIRSHYDLDKNAEPRCGGARTAVRVTVADALDKLAGYLGLRIEPSGSSDPYGLRRAATALIEASWAWPGHFPSLDRLFKSALDQYAAQQISLDEAAAHRSFFELISSRYSALLPDLRHDILNAAILDGSEAMDPKAVVFRSQCLEKLSDDIAFTQMATRPMNIVTAARKKSVEFCQKRPLDHIQESQLDSREGVTLLELLKEIEPTLAAAKSADDVEEVIRQLRRLEGPVNAFFESTMVMDENPTTRYARLSLMQACSEALRVAGDFT